MNSVSPWSIVILGTAFVSLLGGSALFLSTRKAGADFARLTNHFAWVLIALFPVLILFSFFPSSTATATIFGFSFTGAAALFVFIWLYGAKNAIKSIEADQATADTRAGLVDQQQHVEELNNRIQALKSDLERSQKLAAAKEKPQVLTETQVFEFPLRGPSKKRVGIITGNIERVGIADIWVNSENNNMEMSRFYEATISGMIRYLGAKKNDGGEVPIDGDLIARELKQAMGTRTRVEPTTVLRTSPGELAKRPYNVKAILHVASVQGSPGKGYRSIDNVEDCVSKVLQFADSEIPALQECKSIVFPMLGSGTGQADVAVIAQKLLTRAINHLESNPTGRIDRVYFLAWTNLHLESCKDVLRNGGKVEITD